MVRGLAEGNALGIIYFNFDALEWLGETSASLRRKAPFSQRLGDSENPETWQNIFRSLYSSLARERDYNVNFFKQLSDSLVVEPRRQLLGRACDWEQLPVDNMEAVRRKLVGQAHHALFTPQPIALFCTAIATEDRNPVIRLQPGLERFVFKSSNGKCWHGSSSSTERLRSGARVTRRTAMRCSALQFVCSGDLGYQFELLHCNSWWTGIRIGENKGPSLGVLDHGLNIGAEISL